MKNAYLALAMLIAAGQTAVAAESDNMELRGSIGYDWTGLYVGASTGYARTEDDDAAFPVAPAVTIQLHSEGENNNFGFHIGYMHQMDNWVVGAEYEYTDLDIQYIGDGIGPIPVFLEDAHMIKGRVGYAFDWLLAYGTAGFTYAQTNDAVGLEDWTPMIGAGLAVGVTENLILGAEVTHSFFDDFDGRPIEGFLNNYTARASWKF